MHQSLKQPSSGHVRLVQRKRGPIWYARVRRSDGTQINRKIGPAWTKRGRPPTGHYAKKEATKALWEIIAEVENTGCETNVEEITFDLAALEWLRYSEHDRDVRASTLVDYRGTVTRLIAHFGAMPVASISRQEVEEFKTEVLDAKPKPSARTVNRRLVILSGIFRRAEAKWGIRHNPVTQVKRQREKFSGDLNFLTPSEVQQLVEAAITEQDTALFLVAALTGLRQGELLALHWGDVDFPRQRVHVRRSWDQRAGAEMAPKSGKVRSVPMTTEVVAALDGLSQRERYTEPGALVFPDWDGSHQYHGDLRARFKAALGTANLKSIRFHDLRHTFGTLAAQTMPLTTVQALMGHAHINTTMIYAHYVPAADEAARLGNAFNASLKDPLAIVR